jgi:hypothetical protein
MRLEQLLEEKKESKGTYAGVRFDNDTVERLQTFIEENEIPKSVPTNKLHTTILYSRKYLPDYKAIGQYDKPLIGEPTEFDVWESQPDDDGETSNCLILKYDCEELSERHELLMNEHGATFDFDEYSPHITLSYSIGDMKIDNLDPAAIGNINIVKEYQEDLNFDWAKDNT